MKKLISNDDETLQFVNLKLKRKKYYHYFIVHSNKNIPELQN